MHVLLFLLFFVLFASRTLNFDLSLAPGLSVKNAFLYVIFGSLAIEAAITRRYRLEMVSVLAPFFLYAVYATVTWVVVVFIIQHPSYSPRGSLISLKSGPIEHFLVLLIFFYSIKDLDAGIWLIRSMVWLIIVGNVVTVMDTLNLPDLGIIDERVDGRVGGTIGNSNEFAAFLALFIPVIVAFFWSEQGIKRFFVGLGAVLSGVAFVMAVSRGAIIAILVGAIVGVIFLRGYLSAPVVMRAAFGSLLLGLAILIGGFASGYGELLFERFAQFDADGATATSGRTIIWGLAIDRMLEHPISFLTGFGWNFYNYLNFRFATHNAYLGILFNLGTIGLTLFLVTVSNILFSVRTSLEGLDGKIRTLLIGFIFGFLALLIALFFNELYSSWLYVWAFVGIVLRIAVIGSSMDRTESGSAQRPRFAAFSAGESAR